MQGKFSCSYDLWPINVDGFIEWGVKRTLLEYMQRDETFSWDVEGGATFSLESGVSIPATSLSGSELVSTGSVVLRAHDGALTVPLVKLTLENDILSIDDPGGSPGDRLPLANLEPAGEPTSTEHGMVYKFTSRLAPEADYLFLFNYLPGTGFDEVRVLIPA